MAENYNGQAPAAPVESTDRGLFDFGKKKDEVDVHETVQEQHDEGKHHDTLLEKFHQADDKHHNSSSSSVCIHIAFILILFLSVPSIFFCSPHLLCRVQICKSDR